MPKTVYAIGTMDTKGSELLHVKQLLIDAGIDAKCVDVGTLAAPTHAPDISRQQVLGQRALPNEKDRGDAVTEMGLALREFLCDAVSNQEVDGVVGIGGSGGTALITEAMRALPIGFPKLMVSTVASGNTEPYVDCTDITMMYSVVDVAGINVVSRRIFANAARAVAGMVSVPKSATRTKPTVGMTMFGVTTECATRIREALEAEDYDCLVFHATGTGGRAMEKLVESEMITGIIDLTTTEVADELAGGIFPCGSKRFAATIEQRLPFVLSLGAVDMVNFGAMESVPPRYQDRLLHRHNNQITLMRTTPDENREIARWIAERLNHSVAPVTVLIPEAGVSALDAVGQPFHDPEANAELFNTLETSLRCTKNRRIIRTPFHINDAEFADEVGAEFLRLYQSPSHD